MPRKNPSAMMDKKLTMDGHSRLLQPAGRVNDKHTPYAQAGAGRNARPSAIQETLPDQSRHHRAACCFSSADSPAIHRAAVQETLGCHYAIALEDKPVFH